MGEMVAYQTYADMDTRRLEAEKEIKQLKEDLRSKVAGKSAAGLALAAQNIRLIKEKEWLLNRILEDVPCTKKELIIIMQQALEE